MSTYSGNFWSETLNSSDWNYNWTSFYMDGGNDTVSTPSTGVSYYFSGGTGNDYFLGDTGSDIATGGTGRDRLYGHSGADQLYGNSGTDSLYGGRGADALTGGHGKDFLSGGSGSDTFKFTQGSSNSTSSYFSGADVITDWNVNHDWIDSTIAGTRTGYSEGSTSATSIGSARYQVEHSSMKNGDHAFLYNARTDTGYLLSDLDGNFTFETGVIIRGAGSASDMSYGDII